MTTDFDYVAVQLVYRYIGDEIAVNTFHCSGLDVNGAETNADPGQMEGLAAAILTAWTDEIESPQFSNQLYLQVVKCYAISHTDHKAFGEGQAVPGDTVRGAATTALPPQISACVTTWGYDHTGFVTHPSRRRGRMYLPGVAASAVDATGLFTTDTVAQYRQHVVDLFNAVNAYRPVTTPNTAFRFQPAVYSKVGQALYPIQEVSTDTIPDVQRRRVNQLSGTTQFSPVNHTG